MYETSYRLTNFDEVIICPMFGFKDKMDYYTRASLWGKLHKITKCPTMFIQANDDPFMLPESFPREEIARNPNLSLAITSRGGHCCHLSHSERKFSGIAALDWLSCFFPSSTWFSGPTVEFFNAIERQHKEGNKAD